MMLPPVEADETLVAHGVYQQVRGGKPTPVREFWTAHSLPDAATIWRSQLLYDGVLPLSACYLLRNPEHRPVQMVFMWRWQDGGDGMVEYRFMPGYMEILHGEQVNQMILPVAFDVYGWHTITEHFLCLGYDRAQRGTQRFTLVCPNIQDGTLWPMLMSVDATLSQTAIMPGQGGPHPGYLFDLDQPEIGPQQLRCDAFGVPLAWTLPGEQLTVELTEYTRVDATDGQ
ncbi:MAG: hypothetical protein JW910_04760 [Anaerolineae bacterium]|nr:hypothetical protein [Anaerolineae bacterium]